MMQSISASTVLTATAAALSYDHIASFQDSFRTNPAYRVVQNAVTQTSVDDIALNREIVMAIDHSFSTTLDDWSVTHQKRSGRCWMFAGLNLFRPGAMAKMNLKTFEFSQNYGSSPSLRPELSLATPSQNALLPIVFIS
jgi:aminopeptidase C